MKHGQNRSGADAAPCAELRSILRPAYRCEHFDSECKGAMRWQPAQGHVPRGFCGALGQLEEIELVLIVAEPGNPHPSESYPANSSPEEFLEAACHHAYQCFESGKDQYHRNIRYILNLCWPKLTFAEQMRKTWITESTLCSAPKESGHVPAAITRCCVESYLRKQLSLLPRAVVATLGGKAQKRTTRLERALGREFIHAAAASPPGCNFREARESWKKICEEVCKRRNSQK